MRKNERIIEYSFLLKSICARAPDDALDVGTGYTCLPALIAQCGIETRAIDLRNINRFFAVESLDITKAALPETFDFISCISVLEHIDAPDAAVSNMVQMLKPNGHLCLTFPYNAHEYIENVYTLDGAGYGQHADFPCHVFCRENIANWIAENGLAIVEQQHWECFTGEFWTFGERVFPPVLVGPEEPHHLTCLLLRLESDIDA